MCCNRLWGISKYDSIIYVWITSKVYMATGSQPTVALLFNLEGNCSFIPTSSLFYPKVGEGVSEMFLHRNVQSFSGYPKVLPHQPKKCSTFSTSWVFSRVSSWWDYLPRWIIEPPLPAFLNVEEQWFFSKLLLGYQTSSPICKGVHLARNTHFSCQFSGSYPTFWDQKVMVGRKVGQ